MTHTARIRFQVSSSGQQPSKRPIPILQKAVNKGASVRLKSDLEYRGKVSSVDPYMNLILVDAEEYENGKLSANYGKVVIRGNNVLYVKIDDSI